MLKRFQSIMPHAADVGGSAAVSVKFAATGIPRTYDVPWQKTGVPLQSQGPVPARQGFAKEVTLFGSILTQLSDDFFAYLSDIAQRKPCVGSTARLASDSAREP